MDKHIGYDAQRTGTETRALTHARTQTRDGDCAFDYRSTTSLSPIIEAHPPFVSIMIFSLSSGGCFFDRGVAQANFVIHWFRWSRSIVGVIVATRKGESPGNLAIFGSSRRE